MKNLRILSIFIILAVLVTVAGAPTSAAARPSTLGTSPIWGAAGTYNVLANTTVTNTGPTSMPGDLGTTVGAVTDLGVLTVGPPGSIHVADGHAGAAMVDNTAVYGALSQGCEFLGFGGGVPIDLVGMTLAPGVYCADAFALSGTLNLTGGAGDVYIFRSAATLVTSGTANIVGGDPCNVWWQVPSSATLGTGTRLIGNILASTSIAIQTGATLNGRALAQTGAVTLDTNVITGPVCLVPPVIPPVVVPAVEGLPDTGGAPIRSEAASWTLAIAGIGISAVALVLGIRGTRRNRLPKQ